MRLARGEGAVVVSRVRVISDRPGETWCIDETSRKGDAIYGVPTQTLETGAFIDLRPEIPNPIVITGDMVSPDPEGRRDYICPVRPIWARTAEQGLPQLDHYSFEKTAWPIENCPMRYKPALCGDLGSAP